MIEGRLERATPDTIDRLVQQRWGVPVVAIDRLYIPSQLEGLLWRDRFGEIQGLVTWAVSGGEAEIVTMDAN